MTTLWDTVLPALRDVSDYGGNFISILINRAVIDEIDRLASNGDSAMESAQANLGRLARALHGPADHVGFNGFFERYHEALFYIRALRKGAPLRPIPESAAKTPDFETVRAPSEAFEIKTIDFVGGAHAYLLKKLQGIQPELMHVVTPGNEFEPIAYRVNDYGAYVRLLERGIGRFIETPTETYPELVPHCDLCSWWEQCEKRRRGDDHLCYVAGIKTSQIESLRSLGVPRLADLANLNDVPNPPRGSTEALVRVRDQARMQLRGREAKAPVYELIQPFDAEHGLARLPEPTPDDVFLDFEGNHFAEHGVQEYLTGFLARGADGKSVYTALTLSRGDLYELVWSKPMTELAQDFGLSDVALAKRCRKLAVPVPGRGYWARVAAGQTPRQAALRKRVDEPMDYTALTFDGPRENTSPSAAAEPAEPNPLREKIQSLELINSEDLYHASTAVKRTAMRMKRPWRREIVWNRGERQGPIISIAVSESCADRALHVCERILAGAAALGWSFKAPPKKEESRSYRYSSAPAPEEPTFGCLDVAGEFLTIRIDERNRRVDYELTEAEKAQKRRGEYVYTPRWDYVPTGELRLHLTRADSSWTTRTWKDGVRLKLEDQTKTVLTALLDESIAIKNEREARRLAEIERRRQERLEMEVSERRAANAKLVHELEAQAGAWLRARFFRLYLRALQRALGTERLTAKRQSEQVDFLDWAKHYIDQLDPLCKTPHDADMKSERPGYYTPPETKLDAVLGRLLGQRWEDAYKLGTPEESARSVGSDACEEDEDFETALDDAE